MTGLKISKAMREVSVVIPAFNEAPRIAVVIKAIKPFATEIIVVDDASSDGTAAIAESCGVAVHRFFINQGYIAAIKKGFQLAKKPIVVTMDADGEFPAEKIPELVRPILEGRADMVQGKRSVPPRFTELILTKFASLKYPVGDSGTGMRALKTELAQQLNLDGRCNRGVLALEVAYLKSRIAEVPIELVDTDKPRRLDWGHLRQLTYISKWIPKNFK